MKDSNLLILLDFDSLIYQEKNWRIIHPKVGKVGSSVDLLWVLNFYLENKCKNYFHLFDYCRPDIQELPVVEEHVFQNQENSLINEINIMPIEKICDVILQHRIRGRKIYFLTLILSDIIQEKIYNILSKYDIKNLLHHISWKEYWITPENNFIKSYEYPQFAKLLYLKKLIQTLNEENQDFTTKFKRIFYYSTDLAMIKLIQQYFMEHLLEYPYKQNTVITYLITKIK